MCSFLYISLVDSVLDSYGIEGKALLSYVGDADSVQHLEELPVVTNELILNLVKFKHLHQKCTYNVVYHWIKDIYGEKWPLPDSPTCQAIIRCIERLSARFLKLKKQHSSSDKKVALDDFLQGEFSLPTLGFRKGKVITFSPKRPSKKSGSKVCMDMKQKLYAVNRNANKRLKRREAKILEQERRIKEQEEIIAKYERKLSRNKETLKKLRLKLDRVNHRSAYWEAKAHESCLEKSRAKLCAEMSSLKEEIASLHLTNAELNEALQCVMSESDISTFEDGRYTDDIRACVYELLSLNVGVRNVAPIIRCVLKNVAHKSISRLPSYGLTCQMMLESLAVVQAQLGDSLSDYCTLQTDGTTKFGEHYATFDISTSDCTTYSLGMRHVFSGSASNTLETFKEILSDLDDANAALGKEAVGSKILLKIKNTMSDRHAAEKLFNDILHDYRVEILPTVVTNWETMDIAEKEHLMRMNNFFCGLHYVVGLAECTDECLKLWESASDNLSVQSTSGTQRLVRTACKAFHHRGSQKAGSSVLFQSFLRKHNINKIPLAHFVGNRFNVLFYDAAGVYYLQHLMVRFIESIHGVKANQLLQSVLRDLKTPNLIAGCRALGLVDKIITGPLWRKLVSKSMSVLSMGATYCKIKEKFDLWSEDASSLIDGSAICVPDIDVHKDTVWESLVQPDSSDAATIEILQFLSRAFAVTTQRLLVDHLPGGTHHGVTDGEIVAESASVPTTNVSPERDFAILDRYLREKPNAHLVALEALILFSHNKTSSWLDSLSCEERKTLFQAARSLAPSIKRKFKLRQQVIEVKRQEDLRRRAEAIACKELKAVQEREKLTKEMEKVGLWTSRAEVEDGLEKLARKTRKIEVLKLQINFRNKVLGQKHPNKDVFRFSHNRKQYSTNQLKMNLLSLVESMHGDNSTDNPMVTDRSTLEQMQKKPTLLVGKKIRHRFEVGKELVWYIGTVLSVDLQTKEFQVHYEGESDICSFTLLDDILHGDLELL